MSEAGLASESVDADHIEISVVIPTLNEQAGIKECIQRVRDGFEALGMTGEIIVSDSSTDRTPEIASRLGARVVTPDKDGYGYAYMCAFEYVRGDIVVIGDGDTTYDFSQLPLLVRELQQGADLVLGSRFRGEIQPGAMPWLHQYVGNPLLTKFLNVFYRMDVSDSHSGFRAFRRELLEEIDLDAHGMEFASEMIIRAKAADLEIREVPITYHTREGDAVIESFADGWRHLRFLSLNAPGEIFIVPGIFFLCLGFSITLIALGDVPPLEFLSVNTITAGSLLVILGTNVVALGVFSSLVGEPIRNPRRVFTGEFTDRLDLRDGHRLGLLLFVAGSLAAAYLLKRWIRSGFETVPEPEHGILTMAVIVLGLQIVFHMVFISFVERID